MFHILSHTGGQKTSTEHRHRRSGRPFAVGLLMLHLLCIYVSTRKRVVPPSRGEGREEKEGSSSE